MNDENSPIFNQLLTEEFGNSIIDELIDFSLEILSINNDIIVDSSHTQSPVKLLSNSQSSSNSVSIKTRKSSQQRSPTPIILPKQPTKPLAKPIVIKNVNWSNKEFPQGFFRQL